jgi:hypothetical protein
MSTETVMDMSLDTQTELPANFTCSCKILILSPYLTELPKNFLLNNVYVKILDMSKCTQITIIPNSFCGISHIEHIIWPPNIKCIKDNCLQYNYYIQKVDLSYCTQLSVIEDNFCINTNITDITLPVSIKIITFDFLYNNKALTHLDLSYCIQLTSIDCGFCADTNIKSIRFPKSLQKIAGGICYGSNPQELDFGECKDIKINTYMMCEVETVKLYSIDNIDNTYKIQCKNLHIYNVTETKSLNLTFIEDLVNVYLPEGEYCIVDAQSKDYLNVKFWLHSSVFTAEHFSTLRWHSYIPVCDLIVLDTQLDTV